MSENLKSAAAGVRTVLILSVLGMAVGYLLRLYLARSLSVAEFGLLYAILSFTSIFVIFRDFGLSTTVSKFVSEYLAKGKIGEIKSTIISSFAIQFTIGIVIFSSIFIFSQQLSVSYFNTPEAVLPLQVMAASFLISIIITTFQSVSQGYGRMELYASVEFIRVSFVFVSAFFLIKMGVLGVTISYLFASIVLAVTYIFLMVYKFDFLQHERSKEPELTKKLILFTTPLFIASLGSLFLFYMDTVILTAFRSLEEVGFYNVAMPTAQILMIFASISSAVLLPYVSRFWSTKENDKIAKGITILTRYILLIALPVAVGFIVFSDVVIGTLFGASYLGATQTLRILEVSVVFSILFSIMMMTIIGIGKPVVFTKINLSMALISIILNILLVPKFGIVAAAFTSLFVYAIGFVSAYLYVRKNIVIPIPKPIAAKIILSNLIMAIIVFSLREAFGVYSLEWAALCYLAGLAVYVSLIFAFKLVGKEDEKIISSFGIPVPKFIKKVFFGD